MNKDLSQLLTYPSELMGNENGMPTSDDQQRALDQASEVDNAIVSRLNIKFPILLHFINATEEGVCGRALPPFASFLLPVELFALDWPFVAAAYGFLRMPCPCETKMNANFLVKVLTMILVLTNSWWKMMIRMPKQSANLSLFEGPASELDLEPPKIESETEVTTKINFSLRTSRYLHLRRFTAVFSKSPAQRAQENATYPTWKKVGICLATGICAVQLQSVFIFGQRITDLALGNDEASSSLKGATTDSGGAAIV